MVKIAAIIPARGGSKGLIRKNMRKLGSMTLTQIAAVQAQNIAPEAEIYVSTEDDEIAASVDMIAKVIKRPMELAGDKIGTLPVICHAVEQIDAEWFMLLQPTNPFRQVHLLSKQLQNFFRTGRECGLSGYDFEGFVYTRKPFRPINRTMKLRKRRQDKASTFVEDGAFYVFNRDVLNQPDWIWGDPFLFDGLPCIDIHTPAELDLAKKLWSNEWLN